VMHMQMLSPIGPSRPSAPSCGVIGAVRVLFNSVLLE
jgi:hypothetical protein